MSGFLQIFGSKIQDCFQTFFQNNNFFSQTQGYQTGDQNRPLKTQEQSSFVTLCFSTHSVCTYIQSVRHGLKINWRCWNPLSISHKAVCQAENIRKKSQKLLNYYYWLKNLGLKFSYKKISQAPFPVSSSSYSLAPSTHIWIILKPDIFFTVLAFCPPQTAFSGTKNASCQKCTKDNFLSFLQIFTGIDCENLVKVVKISFSMKFIFSGSRSKF